MPLTESALGAVSKAAFTASARTSEGGSPFTNLIANPLSCGVEGVGSHFAFVKAAKTPKAIGSQRQEDFCEPTGFCAFGSIYSTIPHINTQLTAHTAFSNHSHMSCGQNFRSLNVVWAVVLAQKNPRRSIGGVFKLSLFFFSATVKRRHPKMTESKGDVPFQNQIEAKQIILTSPHITQRTHVNILKNTRTCGALVLYSYYN